MEKIFDVIIIGAGPAGLSAALYAGRAKLDALVIEKGIEGGQITLTADIENYPGSMETESGASLMGRFKEQAVKFGAKFVSDAVIDVDFDGEPKTVKCRSNTYYAKTVIIATGASPSKIGCPGEAEFTGRGVSYCATCDAAFFEGMEIFVVGGGDAAVEEALYLARFGRKVHVIHRRDQLRAAKSIQEKAFANEKIDFLWNSTVESITGKDAVECITIKDTKTGELREIRTGEFFGVFVFIGYTPQTELFKDKVIMEKGYILTDESMRTSTPGIFAAGDCRIKTLRQVVTAAADGAIAATEAAKYIEEV